MRRKISLYIGGLLADLDEQAIVLMTWTREDTENPTIVRNSFSRQVTLPGTGRNAAIFGSYYRLDRRIDRQSVSPVGTGFTPTQKVPFELYNELGEIIEAGYVRLDKVTRKGRIVQDYTVTLFGGLGTFLYLLSYSQGGNRLSLADLPYLSGIQEELDFTINASSVKSAWQRLGSGDGTNRWDIINFAPCYNGIPENFDADKGIIDATEVPTPRVMEGDYYYAYPGLSKVLVNLPQPVDEWAAKDLRSYLQRPVLSVAGLVQGIKNYAQALGWTFSENIPFRDETWLTLPMLNETKTESSSISETVNFTYNVQTTARIISTGTPTGPLDGGMQVSLHTETAITFNLPSAFSPTLVGLRNAGTGKRPFSVVFFQVVAVSSVNTVIGGSKVFAYAPYLLRSWTPKDFAQVAGFSPEWSTPLEETYADEATITGFSGGGTVYDTDNVNAVVSSSGPARYYAVAAAYLFYENADGTIALDTTDPDNGDYSTPVLWDAGGTKYTASGASLYVEDVWLTVSSSWARSGAVITKQILLQGEHSPADYLVALAKIYGLSFIVDGAAKTVDLVTRNDYYQNETVDLTGRVDTSRTMEVYPLAIASKWYDFALDGDAAKFWERYLADYGRTYGTQRVNTGYEFDASVKNLLDGCALRGAASILDSSIFWNIIVEAGMYRPSPFILPDVTCTLYTTDGDSNADFPVSQPGTVAVVTYYNHVDRGYDLAPAGRLEFRDKDGKQTDGRDVLVFYNGKTTLARFKITDDDPVMARLNNNVPCWILDSGLVAGIDVPDFSRIQVSAGAVDQALDLGEPFELGIPGVRYGLNVSLYDTAWKYYLADRYDADTKVLHCFVDFGGMQVGPELLRKFYYFDGAIWSLNKIVNYSLTTWDPVECEFVQVQDTANYLSGQIY